MSIEELTMLLAAKNAARDAYYNHKSPGGLSPEEQVAFDLREKFLMRRFNAAEQAYGAALLLMEEVYA